MGALTNWMLNGATVLRCGCCGAGLAAFGFPDGCVQENEAEQAPAEQWEGESEEDHGRDGDQDTCPAPAEERPAGCRPAAQLLPRVGRRFHHIT